MSVLNVDRSRATGATACSSLFIQRRRPLLSVKSLKKRGQRSSFIRWRGIGKAAASKSRDPVATDGVGEDVTLPELLLLMK